ncbi:MAG: ComEA family DNA-binding protein [Solirubrobacterales bacterium]
MAMKINLNTATRGELGKIKGIGDQCAQAIIDYRAEHGRFSSVEDLDKIPGFGKKAMEHLRDQATV